MDEITVGHLKRFTNRTQEIMLDLIGLKEASDVYAEFVRLINAAIDWCVRELAKNPELCVGLSEDQLTAKIITPLRAMGFDASHDTKVGGHCDIVIEALSDLLWLGEAKIHRDYAWLYKGFQQLNSRYATAALNQDAGGIIVYCFQPRVDQVMNSWRAFLSGEIEGIEFHDCDVAPPAFYSEHIHERTGRRFRVRHIPVSLLFVPEDRIGPRKRARRAAR